MTKEDLIEALKKAIPEVNRLDTVEDLRVKVAIMEFTTNLVQALKESDKEA